MKKQTGNNKALIILGYDIKTKNIKTLKKYCLGELINTARKRNLIVYEKDECLFSAGKPVKYIQCLLYGKVKIVNKDVDDKENVLHIIRSPDIFYLYSVLNEKVHSYSAVALKESCVISIPVNEFREILRNNTTLTLGIMRLICASIKNRE
jgi:CRP-like cAMP-binding protein